MTFRSLDYFPFMVRHADHKGGGRQLPHRELGFTLLEILVVLAIIALVAAFVGPRLMAQLDRSKVTAARVQIRSLVSSLETMRLDLGRYPTESEGLAMLVTPPPGVGEAGELWQGPYLDSGLPEDPWGRPYLYTPPAGTSGRPTVGSLGADGAEGGDGIDADLFFGNRGETAAR